MEDDFPHGSVFGGYGFFRYSAMPIRPRSRGNAAPPAPAPSNGGAGLRRVVGALLSRWRRAVRG